MYYLRFTDDINQMKSFNHFTGEEFQGVCAYPLDNVEEMGLSYEIRNNTNSTYQKFYDGRFVVFAGYTICDNPNHQGVIAEVSEIVATGIVEDGEWGWVVKELNHYNGYDNL